MTSPFRRALRRAPLALCTLLGSAPALAQSKIDPRAPEPPLRVQHNTGLVTHDGGLLGVGADYKVNFAAGSVEFTPALGTRAPRNFPVRFTLTGFGRGTATHAPARATAPGAAGRGVRYDHGAMVEQYDLHPRHIEQSFVFHELPPGDGDLLVRGRLATDLAIAPDGDGLRLELAGVGGIRIGAVVGIDARGARAAGRVRYVAGELELSLPASFVASATLPLTLDPPLGNAYFVSGPGGRDERVPVAAYDASHDVYLVVWTMAYSASDLDIYAQRISGAGNALVGTNIVIEGSSAFENEPAVANVAAVDAFVVTYSRGGDVFARSVAAATAAVSPAVVVAGTAGVQRHAAVSGTASPVAQNCVIAWRNDATDAIETTRVFVGTDHSLAVSSRVSTIGGGSNGSPRRPSLAKSNGLGGWHALVYQRDFATHSDIRAVALDDTGTPITAEAGIADDPDHDSLPAVDGDGAEWVVTWQRTIAGSNTNVLARAMTIDLRNGALVPAASRTQLLHLGATQPPQVVFVGDSCLLGWSASATVGFESLVTSLDPARCGLCERTFRLPRIDEYDLAPRGASTLSGGGPTDRALLVWETTGSASNWNSDIVARAWLATDGDQQSLGGSCGHSGTIRASCAAVPNEDFTLRLRTAPANTPVALALADSTAPSPCGSCTFGPDLARAVVLWQTTTAAGQSEVRVPLPRTSSLRGATIYAQWYAVSGSGAACANLLNMSDTLRLVIDSL